VKGLKDSRTQGLKNSRTQGRGVSLSAYASRKRRLQPLPAYGARCRLKPQKNGACCSAKHHQQPGRPMPDLHQAKSGQRDD
jgi:hypothetical protein